MILKLAILSGVFVLGEIICNLTIFKYLRKAFPQEEQQGDVPKEFLRLNISVFKGLLERFVLFTALVMGLSQILIVFGTLKIGSRFDKNNKIKNDYFIIGNFVTILLVLIYLFCFQRILCVM